MILQKNSKFDFLQLMKSVSDTAHFRNDKLYVHQMDGSAIFLLPHTNCVIWKGIHVDTPNESDFKTVFEIGQFVELYKSLTAGGEDVYVNATTMRTRTGSVYVLNTYEQDMKPVLEMFVRNGESQFADIGEEKQIHDLATMKYVLPFCGSKSFDFIGYNRGNFVCSNREVVAIAKAKPAEGKTIDTGIATSTCPRICNRSLPI